jgi:RNA polymerase sigma-70 factor, ECF subfamily
MGNWRPLRFMSRLVDLEQHGAVTPQPRSGSRPTLLRLAPEPSDEELVAAVRAGDRQAADWLVLRHAPRVTRVLARILGGDPDLVDHAQEVLFRALRELGQLREAGAFRGWVAALAVTEARRVLRKRARWRWLFGEPVEVELVDEGDEAGREAMSAVYDVLARLREDERTAFALRYLEGMELTEVAAAMGISLATAKRRLQSGRRRFAVLAKSQPALVPWLGESRLGAEEEEEEP